MIKYKTLRWSNAFSYGADNEIDFSAHALTQLVGKNGHGKSSIPAILEEVLYNKNSKGIKKADILNRYATAKSYSIEFNFEKDGDEYTILTKRGSTQSVVLTKNGKDISAHTSTNTYKLIEEIVGYDHKTFSQIVYQSSSSSLEFLTATDTTRKKFLIELLNLSKYIGAAEVFKAVAKDVADAIIGDKSSLNTVNAWLAKLDQESLEVIELKPVEVNPTNKLQEIAVIKVMLNSLEEDTKAIIQNNQYKKILDSIVIDINAVNPGTTDLADKKSDIEAYIRAQRASISQHKHSAGISECPTCHHPIDNTMAKTIVERAEQSIKAHTPRLLEINTELDAHNAAVRKFQANIAAQSEWEKYHNLYNPKMSSIPPDRTKLELDISKLEQEVKKEQAELAAVTAFNTKATAHNSKVAVLLSQKAGMLDDLAKTSMALKVKERLLNLRQILTKTFSTTGLVAYKLECLVKDLEEETNKYLVVLADGRFQISFKISNADKLNVVITDNGKDIEISALSSGELARVNVSTLLAIRKLMQAISNSRTNLLILDETVENLDLEGKEKLIEILLDEEYLNTVLISHSFTHPLLEKIQIIKEDNISRIEK